LDALLLHLPEHNQFLKQYPQTFICVHPRGKYISICDSLVEKLLTICSKSQLGILKDFG
jgi:hypothetical protein